MSDILVSSVGAPLHGTDQSTLVFVISGLPADGTVSTVGERVDAAIAAALTETVPTASGRGAPMTPQVRRQVLRAHLAIVLGALGAYPADPAVDQTIADYATELSQIDGA